LGGFHNQILNARPFDLRRETRELGWSWSEKLTNDEIWTIFPNWYKTYFTHKYVQSSHLSTISISLNSFDLHDRLIKFKKPNKSPKFSIYIYEFACSLNHAHNTFIPYYSQSLFVVLNSPSFNQSLFCWVFPYTKITHNSRQHHFWW
jgi:hypothetical protein